MQAAIWWSALILVLGACVGSFLNVIIYRWPRNLLARRPLWSFCPRCGHTLAWHDNIPVLSCLRLGGRCRYCRGPISLQYPFVELACALLFLMVYDGFFVGRQRLGVAELSADWPMLLAHWTLAAGLLALAVMDLEAYMVDIRLTWIITGAGLAAHSLWTPPTSLGPSAWIRPSATQAAIAAAAAAGLGIGAGLAALLAARHENGEDRPPVEPPGTNVAVAESAGDSAPVPPDAPAARSAWWIVPPMLLVLAYAVAMQLQPDMRPLASSLLTYTPDGRILEPGEATDHGAIRLLAGAAVLFAALALAAAHPHPEEDAQILETIAAEAGGARRIAATELLIISPAIVLAVGVHLALARWPALAQTWESWLHARPLQAWTWQPLLGLATGLCGWILGGAVAWLARIVFTLAFGREALGMGDVHILAATGAVAGWVVAFLGFFVAAPLALLALMVIRLRRQARALPYGPWLALGFLVVVLFQDRILEHLNLRGLLDRAWAM